MPRRGNDDGFFAAENAHKQSASIAHHFRHFITIVLHHFQVKSGAHDAIAASDNNNVGIGFGLVHCRIYGGHHVKAEGVGFAVIQFNDSDTFFDFTVSEVAHFHLPNLVAF